MHTEFLVGKPKAKKPRGRPYLTWEDKIQTYYEETGWGYVD
jgi:hypothetical protein